MFEIQHNPDPCSLIYADVVLRDGTVVGHIVRGGVGYAYRRKSEWLDCVRAATFNELLKLIRVIETARQTGLASPSSLVPGNF